jgi:hypothetical protein
MTAIPVSPHLQNNELDLAMDLQYPRMNQVLAGAAPVDEIFVENSRKRSRFADENGTLNDKRRFKLHLHTVEHQSLGQPGIF